MDGAKEKPVSNRNPGSQDACPICGKPHVARYRPFCSSRCTEVDLGRWLKGAYRLPTEERPGEQTGDELASEPGLEPRGQE